MIQHSRSLSAVYGLAGRVWLVSRRQSQQTKPEVQIWSRCSTQIWCWRRPQLTQLTNLQPRNGSVSKYNKFLMRTRSSLKTRMFWAANISSSSEQNFSHLFNNKRGKRSGLLSVYVEFNVPLDTYWQNKPTTTKINIRNTKIYTRNPAKHF